MYGYRLHSYQKFFARAHTLRGIWRFLSGGNIWPTLYMKQMQETEVMFLLSVVYWHQKAIMIYLTIYSRFLLFFQITGANKILLFYTTLKEKTHKSEPNKNGLTCLRPNEFPREISNSAIKILIAKAEEERLSLIKDPKEVENENSQLKKDVQRLEEKLNKILNALRIPEN